MHDIVNILFVYGYNRIIPYFQLYTILCHSLYHGHTRLRK